MPEGTLRANAPTWVIQNLNYSQAVDRHERFERIRAGA